MTTRVRWAGTCRLVPSRYPSAGILDQVANAKDLPYIFELESWTNDRISNELGLLHRIPEAEWVVGKPMATVVMAAFCHPRPMGSRFNGPERGAWYAGTSSDIAHAEAVYHRTAELAEVGVFETRVQMRMYLADFNSAFHDVRPNIPRIAHFTIRRAMPHPNPLPANCSNPARMASCIAVFGCPEESASRASARR